MSSWKWYEVLCEDSGYGFGDLVPKNSILIGYVNDDDASYEHTEHRFYKIDKKYVYVYSSGCSCWDDNDAYEEWQDRKEFNSFTEMIKYINGGEYPGHTISEDLIKEIKVSLSKLKK